MKKLSESREKQIVLLSMAIIDHLKTMNYIKEENIIKSEKIIYDQLRTFLLKKYII